MQDERDLTVALWEDGIQTDQAYDYRVYGVDR